MKLKNILVLFLLLISLSVSAADIPELKSRINDYAKVLTSNEEAQLEQYLYDLEQKTSAQVALLTINSLDGNSIEDYSIKVVEKWKLGQKDLDNGVLLLISTGDRKLRIEVGYGLEDILTDLKCSYIIRQIIVPEFKRNNYPGGIAKGLAAISGSITNEYIISDEELAKYQKNKQNNTESTPLSVIFFIIIFLFVGLRGGPLGLLFMILFGRSFGYSSSRYHSSGFGGGGFSGGGFSGGGGSFGGGSFGGGSFGGGGSSGGW